MNKTTHINRFRLWCQIAFAALTNGYVTGFVKGDIFKGPSKGLCVPGLSCHSCPGALFACPVGALQAVLGSRGYHFSLYVFGVLGVFGTLFGRFVCGWLCPFGLVQDLLGKIPVPFKRKTLPGHKILSYLKYLVLLILVILLPMFVRSAMGQGEPWFCAYLCPSGTLFAGIPLLALKGDLRGFIGGTFFWKLGVLIAVLTLSTVVNRPFCQYLCPLGALYGLFNPIALYRYKVEEHCVDCGACQKACPFDIDVSQTPNSAACIRCGACQKACPAGAITSTFDALKKNITSSKSIDPNE